MAASRQFIAVNFSQGQLLDVDTLNQLSNNTVYLRDQMVDAKYQYEWGGVVDINVKLLAGKTYVPPSGDQGPIYVTIGFTNIFTPGCNPIITTGLQTEGGAKFEHCLYGIGTYHPDHRGFVAKVKVNPAYPRGVFDQHMHVNWTAVGY